MPALQAVAQAPAAGRSDILRGCRAPHHLSRARELRCVGFRRGSRDGRARQRRGRGADGGAGHTGSRHINRFGTPNTLASPVTLKPNPRRGLCFRAYPSPRIQAPSSGRPGRRTAAPSDSQHPGPAARAAPSRAPGASAAPFAYRSAQRERHAASLGVSSQRASRSRGNTIRHGFISNAL